LHLKEIISRDVSELEKAGLKHRNGIQFETRVFLLNSAGISSNTPNKEKSKSQKCHQIVNVGITDIYAPAFSSRLIVAIS
jgi:hypothetical protein